MKTRKVVIIGAGHVGSHVALGLIQSGEADDIVLIDILKEKYEESNPCIFASRVEANKVLISSKTLIYVAGLLREFCPIGS